MKCFHPTIAALMLILLGATAAGAATPPHWQEIEQHGDVPPPLYEAGISFSLASGAQDAVYSAPG